MIRITYLLSLFILTLFAAGSCFAEDEEVSEEEAAKPKIQYLELKPEIIANYGVSSGTPRLLNADVTLQINDEDTATKVSMYLIPIRHDLIMMFSNLYFIY